VATVDAQEHQLHPTEMPHRPAAFQRRQGAATGPVQRRPRRKPIRRAAVADQGAWPAAV